MQSRTPLLSASVSRSLVLAAMATLLLLSGCASTPRGGDSIEASPERVAHDPFEGMNRAVFAFNDGVDRVLVKPLAKTYEAVTPRPARRGVSNFFANLRDVVHVANHLLQFRPGEAARHTGRVFFNSTFGIAGLIDVATPMGLERQPTDFGQTLGRWGAEPGPYLVLPLIGPSTLRDAPGWAVDAFYFSPTAHVTPREDRLALRSLQIIDMRTRLFEFDALVDEVAFDRYTFVREAWLAHRRRGGSGEPSESISQSDHDLTDDLFDEPLWDEPPAP